MEDMVEVMEEMEEDMVEDTGADLSSHLDPQTFIDFIFLAFIIIWFRTSSLLQGNK